MVRIGLISDTHGLLRPGVFDLLAGVERILHAGDVGSVDILSELEVVAPVTAVVGNTDGLDLRARLREEERLEVGGRRIVLVHGHRLGSPNPTNLRSAHADSDVIVYGHTHRSLVDRAAGAALVVNPGAAGPRRFDIQPTVGILTVHPDRMDIEINDIPD